MSILSARAITAMIATVGCASTASAQGVAPSIQVGEDLLLASDSAGRPLVEPHLSVNSSNPRHMIVGAIATTASMDSAACVAFVTFDGGEAWSRHDFGLRTCGDPWE